MGRHAAFSLLSSLTILLSLSAFCFSRELKHGHGKTATLDVAASLSAAHQLLSRSPLVLEDSLSLATTTSSDGTTSFELRARETLKPSGHKDYKNLTLARLRRDAARVEALNSRLALRLQGVSKADLKPLMEEEEEEEFGARLDSVDDLEGPIVSGMTQGSGEYFSRIGIGRPAKAIYVVLDTGSDITWIQCQPCTDCYQQADPIFDPAASQSYAPLSCDSSQCKSLDVSACRNGTCEYQVSYGDGSYTVGDFATETMTFGPSASVDRIAMGCGHDNEGLFVGAGGLLGLGGGSLSFPSQLSTSAFSYCLVDRDSSAAGTLTFGPASAEGADLVRAPLLRNKRMDTFYYVGLSGISVGGSPLSIPPSVFQMDESGNGGVILDSGTAITRLPPSAYASLRDAFSAATPSLPRAPSVSLFDTCYDLSSRTSVDVATIALHFGSGESLQLPAKNYLVPVDSAGTFCFAFAPTTSSVSIIGNVQQQGIKVSFDSANSQVGFAPNKC
ncbi:protein ASPARTIC PROTEASE IN GUARD CELL 1-like [Nymphaea colorata]|uniref:Peptidase A1 domain-containing protein n=1 Tax=Nymphaea colorata TaxID=210225 RepID=A0A5K0Y067_9MAGN|nr:protein ASPARTIC PROTEASE IN GUARD CELL 1-like [Nymphaea colorata]